MTRTSHKIQIPTFLFGQKSLFKIGVLVFYEDKLDQFFLVFCKMQGTPSQLHTENICFRK